MSDLKKVHEQAIRMAELRIHNDWHRAGDWLPDRPLCVLAWDGEAHFIAVYEGDKWGMPTSMRKLIP